MACVPLFIIITLLKTQGSFKKVGGHGCGGDAVKKAPEGVLGQDHVSCLDREALGLYGDLWGL